MPEDVHLYDLAAAFDAQQKAIEKWHFAGVREFVGRIEQIDACPARRDALEVLRG